LDCAKYRPPNRNQIVSGIFGWRGCLNVELKKAKLNEQLTDSALISSGDIGFTSDVESA